MDIGAVVVADDHALFAATVARLLGKLLPRATVRVCLSMADLMRVQERVDLVLLDVYLPDASGAASIDAVRQRFPAATVVLMSGQDELDEAAAIAAGADMLIRKSAEVNAFERDLAHVLGVRK